MAARGALRRGATGCRPRAAVIVHESHDSGSTRGGSDGTVGSTTVHQHRSDRWLAAVSLAGTDSARAVCSRRRSWSASPTRSSTPSKSAVPTPSRSWASCPGRSACTFCRADAGEFYRVGGHTMKRIARASDTGDVHELATFTGNTGATMPRHAHLSSHAAVLVLRGEVEFELGGERWTMMRGDFANLPPGHAARLDDEIRRRADRACSR